MKDAALRLLYAAALSVVTMYFTEFSLPGFIVFTAFWIIPIEGQQLVRNIIHNRRLAIENQPTKELIQAAAKLITKDYDARFNELMRQKLREHQEQHPDVPDTQPLDKP